jgi:transmembrane sensor
LNENINDTVKELIARSLAGDISVEQEKALQQWIGLSAGNQKVFLDYKKALGLSEQQLGLNLSGDLKIDVDEEWQIFRKNIEGKETPVRDINESRNTGWLRIAATLLLIAISAYGIFYIVNRKSVQEFHTADATLNIDLPDGSVVILNRFSSLSYEDDFGTSTRTVNFKGEGFFEVSPNKEKPFIVQLRNARVEVVGTSFNILAYDSLDETQVTVKTGVVTLTANNKTNHVSLHAGQQGSLKEATGTLVSKENDDVNYLSWQSKEIVFEETSLPKVIETLNKTYGVNLVLAGEVSESCVVTVKFSNQSLESVLRVLESTLNFKYTVKGNVIEITAPGC